MSAACETEAGVRLESALEIVGALKDRFGQPITVSDICRTVPLSYQPVYSYVRRLAAEGAVTVRKQGQRLFCEPAATAAGSLWLAQRSLHEVSLATSPRVRELIAALEGRIGADVTAGAVVALDPASGDGGLVYVTDGGLGQALSTVPLRIVSRVQLANALVGRDGSCQVARRILPLCGQQLLWSLALAARDSGRARAAAPSRRRSSRRRAFID